MTDAVARPANSVAEFPSEMSSQVLNILQSYLRELESGGRAGADELTARHPDLAEVLRPYLDQLDGLHRAAAVMRDPAAAPADAALNGRLGDFQILRELGRGGMGIVYEAEQISLTRRVALKVLPFAAVLDHRQLQRFRNEARAAAQLHHTNIVPVFAVGEERGVHYYAMQLIDGQTLAALVGQQRRLAGLDDGAVPRGRPAPADDTAPNAAAGQLTDPSLTGSEYFRTAARLGVQAADALDHAHHEGIVHRDVKPANLLVDGAGRLWVTDFGLARCRSDSGLTMTGDLLGTLRYMSPEQALGKPQGWDHRTDVYSLGVTLYELLTLRPAFDAREREQVLLCVAYQEPVAPRRINRAVPKELETIVLKAMSKDPEGRYATAGEFADDLRRFLEDRPVLARRSSLRERATKWARRHRGLVGVGVLMLALAAVGLGVSAALIWREQAATQAAYEAEARERKRAREHLEVAHKAVEDMYTGVAERWLKERGDLDPVQREFLEKALAFYERFAREYGENPAFRRDTALAHRRVGDIHRRAGRHADAKAAYLKAVPILEELGRGRPEQVADLALALNNLGVSHKYLGGFREAEAAYRRALDLRAGLDAGRPEYRTLPGESQHNLGMLLKDRGRAREAETAFRAAIEHYARAAGQGPNAAGDWHKLAGPTHLVGLLLRDRGRPGEAEKAIRDGLALERKAHAAAPSRVDYRLGVATSCNDLGNLVSDRGEWQEAEGLLREALAMHRGLARDYPERPLYRHMLATSLGGLGWLQRQRGKLADAEVLYQEGIRVSRELVVKHPKSADYKSRLGGLLNNLGELRRTQGKLEDSRACLVEALEQQRAALAINEKQPTYRAFLQSHYGNLAKTLARLGDHAGAVREAAAPAAREPGDWSRHHRAGHVFITLLQQAEKDGAGAEALRTYEEGARGHLAEAARLSQDDARGQEQLAWFLTTLNDPRFRDAPTAVRLARRAVELEEGRGDAWAALGVASYRAGDFAGAVRALEAAERLETGRPVRFYLAMAHARAGDLGRARTWHTEAVRWMEGNRPRDADQRRLRSEADKVLGAGGAANGS